MTSKTYEVGNPPGRDELLEALAMRPPRLDLIALAISRLGNPELDFEGPLRRLDSLANRVRARAGDDPVASLISVLADEEGFEGDHVVFDHPMNSFLDVVLERRRGLPILLSVLYLEVARRAGLEAGGVALPGHFVVQVEKVLIDPFNNGKRLTERDAQRIVKRASSSAQFSAEMLRPPSAKAIATRILNNLKGSWIQRNDTDEALSAVDMLLVLSPRHPSEVRLRAGLLMELGAFRAALTDIESCLTETPQPPDYAALVRTAKGLRDRVGQLH